MPTISVNKNELLKLSGIDFALEDLQNLLCYVKGEYKGFDEESNELRIELNDTNRPDLWSTEGIARQLRFQKEKPDYNELLQLASEPVSKEIVVDSSIEKVRPYVGAFIAKGVAVTDEFLKQMIQTQEKISEIHGNKRELLAIGIYNVDKISFPIHYKAVNPESTKFLPLGVENELNLNQILSDHPKGIEFKHILEGKQAYPLLVDNNSDILSFPPIINSAKSGQVVVGDKNLFIEATGLNLEMVLHALNIFAYNFKDRGYIIEAVNTVFPYDTEFGKKVITPYPLKNEIKVKTSTINNYLGESFTKADFHKHLENYGLSVTDALEDSLQVSSLPYRNDYMHEVDIVEDFAISYGYNNFKPIMPEKFTIGQLAPITLFEDKVRDLMIGFGFEEVIMNVLNNQDDFKDNINNMFDDLVEIKNFMSESYSILRNSLIPSMLKVEANSFKSMYPHKVFEVGEVVQLDKTQNHGCSTNTKLGILIAHSEANFSEMGSYFTQLQYLMNWELEINSKSYPIFIKGRSGEILLNEKPIGLIGEVHPEILEKWNIKMPSVLLELDLTSLLNNSELII